MKMCSVKLTRVTPERRFNLKWNWKSNCTCYKKKWLRPFQEEESEKLIWLGFGDLFSYFGLYAVCGGIFRENKSKVAISETLNISMFTSIPCMY